jgi:hypothetical protein
MVTISAKKLFPGRSCRNSTGLGGIGGGQVNDLWKGCGYAAGLVVGAKGGWRGLVEELAAAWMFLDGGTKYMSEVCTVLGRRVENRT